MKRKFKYAENEAVLLSEDGVRTVTTFEMDELLLKFETDTITLSDEPFEGALKLHKEGNYEYFVNDDGIRYLDFPTYIFNENDHKEFEIELCNQGVKQAIGSLPSIIYFKIN